MLFDFCLELLPLYLATVVRRVVFPRWWIDDLKGASAPWALQTRPDCRETMRLMALPPSEQGDQLRAHASSHCVRGPQRWGLLMPITSRGSDDIWSQLETTLDQLVESVPASHRLHTHVHVGIDGQDPRIRLR